MKARCVWLAGIGLVVVAATAWGQSYLPAAPKVKTPFYIFSDRGEASPGYDYAPSGWMGRVEGLDVNMCSDEMPYHGPCCMKITFSEPTGWAGIVWQNPASNWGNEEGGLDLTGAKRLSFWAKGQKGGEAVEFSMGLLGKDKKFFDTASADIGVTRLSKHWKQYSIPVDGKNLSRIVTGFAFTVKAKGPPVVFYLDDIIYE
mgnify:CR=1 FL=1